MSFFRKYRLLIWKNFLLQKRRPKSTLLEIFLPIFFIFILLVLRVTSIQAKFVDAYNHWQAFSINGSSFNMKSHMGTWVIAFTPNDTKHTKIMEHAKTLAPNIEVEGFYNEKMLVDKVVSDENKMFNIQRYLCGVVFDDKSDNKQVIKYALRFPANPRQGSQKSKLFPSKWYTEFVFPFTFEGLGPRTKKGENAYLGGPPPYYLDGFLDVQKIVDFGIIGMENKSFIDLNIDTSMQRHPYPARIEDPFIIVIQNSFPMLLMLSLVYTALSIVRNIVYEKEKKLKESMKMMGLCGWLHWFAWFTKCFIFLLIPLIVITILMTVKFGDGNGKMLKESDGFLVFIFLILYAIASIMFCFFVSTLFYRANIAAAAGGIFWFLSYVPYFFLFNYYQQMSLTSKVLACLDFQIAMAFGANLIGRFEGSGAGVQWSNLSEGVTVDDTFTFGQVLGMLVLDSFLYGFLTWYIEGIFPGEYGIPKRWYFPLSRKYWCDVQDVENEALIDVDEENDIEVSTPADFIEKEPDNIDCGIKIVNLVKQFKTDSGTKVAVNNLNLNLYEGKITALLGHNGAGKTTTISMLTGLIPPTSGNAFINGHDIINNMASIRSSLGICPQHNVLFDSLTVKEHLWFFTCLKGSTDKDEINKEVTNMIKSLELVDKTNVPSSNLSGGMKRKLSVGIALVGKSKVVILDEPTSGMDVSARRFTWDLLQRERKERTILLTTHFMDEADVLGDRIAIMSSGKIKCCGSSLFLKKKFGVGYHMVMVKEPDCDVTKVSDVITKHIPTAQLESNVGLELSFILPSEFSHKFEELFTEIESERNELKISSYGASVTTLEEVFLKVGEEENVKIETHKKLFRQLSGKDNTGFSSEEDQALPDHRPSSRMLNSSGSFTKPPVVKNQGFRLSFQRWYAMFVKRCIHSKRHKISLISQLLMPSLFVMLALIVVKTMPKAADSPSRDLTLTMFGENKVPILLQSRSIFSNKMERTFKHYLNNKGDPEFLDPDENMTVYLMDKENVDLARFNRKNLVAIEMNGEEGNVQATCFFNNEALHSPAVSLNVFSNALLQYFTGEKEIKTLNHPLPTTTSQSIKDLTANPNGFQIGFSLCFGMSFLASSFIVFLVQERSTKAKHVQFVSGVDPISYWTSAYLWDLINYLLPTVVIILLFFIFQIDAFQGKRVGYVLLLLLLYGWAIIPMMYMFSFAFMVASTAYTRMTILNVITGLAMLLVLFILNIPALDLLDVAKVLNWVFLLFPNFNLGQGVIDIFNNFNIIKTYNEAMDMALRECKQFPPLFQHICEEKAKELIANMTSELPNYETNYLAWQTPGIGRYLIFLTLEGFIFFGLVLMIEAGYFNWVSKVIKFIRCPRCCKRTVTMTYAAGDDGNHVIDSDVYNEQVRIANNEYGTNNVLVLKNLYKVFKTSQGNLTAVDKLSLAVPHGECFGLLGQNGAGKTTTFKILTGDETPSSGSAYVDRFEVSRDLAKVRQRIGYCPQFDALIDLMTGREMLVMYSRLRGVPEHDISELVERLAVNLGVDQYIDKLSKTYSGGNKRKLSTAIALAGDPPLIFLDEPSSGMDPMARRNLWDSISKFIADGKSVIITSHSMEECEALCTRLAIMVNGQFKCLGSPQHLKTKFGDGYTLIARVGGGDTEALKNYINETYPGSILKDEHQGYIHYQLKTDKSWANLFGVMERAKGEYDIEDYSVSQTTLEQVFLNFTRNQRVTDE